MCACVLLFSALFSLQACDGRVYDYAVPGSAVTPVWQCCGRGKQLLAFMVISRMSVTAANVSDAGLRFEQNIAIFLLHY